MLKGIDPLLHGELLCFLDQLGHGDQVALVDRNFPAFKYGVPVVQMMDSNTERASKALLTVFPLDTFVDAPIRRMAYQDDVDAVNDASAALQKNAEEQAEDGQEIKQEGVLRFDFYDLVEEAHLIVMTGETIPYSCFLLRKGVV